MNRLKEIRKKKGYTLIAAATIAGITNNTLSRYETGKREPKLEMWQKLADIYGVSVSYLQGIDKEIYDLKFSTKQEAIDFIHKIMKAQNIKLEDIPDESKRQTVLNLFSTILIISQDDLNDFAGVTDRDRLNAILCFAIDIAERMGFSYKEIKRNIRSADPERLKEFADNMDRAFGSIELLKEVEKDNESKNFCRNH